MDTSTFTSKIKEKRWDPSKEPELYELWEKEGLHEFLFDPSDPREVIVIDTPPPYASGKWHVGGAAHYTQIDMIARYFKMKGYNVLVPFYADRNGLPVEVQVEKAYGINPHEIASTKEGREKFLKLCKEFLDKAEQEIVKIWRRLGCGFVYWRNGTDSPEYRRITQETFIELYKRGLIYEAERPVNWCPRCRTTLADAELEYKDVTGYLVYIKFRVKETGEEVVVATTRPELLRACKALVYNPEDDRYKHLSGKHAIVPLYEHEVPILTHPEVDKEFGTGLVMVCSFGDKVDVKMFRDLGLEPLIIIDKKGFMNNEAGPIAGLPVDEARKKIIEILEEKGYVVKKEVIKHSVPVCWRCKTPVQIINTREWFLKQVEFKDKIREIALTIDFKPEMHRRKLLDWIESVSTDWPISRDRYYATEVPVWRCSVCGSILLPKPGRYYRPWRDEPPWDKCPKCGAPRDKLVGEKKVFDTWFDSSISVLYVTGYKRNPELFKKSFKNTLRPQGEDIIRTWLYYTLLRVYQLTGKPAFKWVRVTGMGLDEKGEAMHKSKGNIIDPEPFLEKYGADAFRYWAAAASKLGYDYRFSEQTIKTGRLFVTKLWNIARFISAFPRPDYSEVKLREIDKALLAKLAKTIEKIDKAYSELDVYVPINEIYQFTWNIFASHYIELVKHRAYNRDNKYSIEEQKASWYTLYRVLDVILRALAPIMPFVTDAIYRRLFGRTVHKEKFPEPEREWTSWSDELIDYVVKANSSIWSYKKKKGIKFKDPLNAVVYVPTNLAPVVEELADLHKISRIQVYSDVKPKGEEIGNGIIVVYEK